MLMFGDQAGFGRISEPANCWAPPKERPCVPSQLIREYKTVYGAVCPETGDAFYQVYKGSNKENMSDFLKALSDKFPDRIILLVLDNASWHLTQEQNSKRRRKNKEAKVKFKTPEMLFIPDNIRIVHLPPRTPELNPIEIIWREIRKRGFKNIIFNKLKDVVDKFFEVVENMANVVVISITRWSWIDKILCEVF
jgi:transposase